MPDASLPGAGLDRDSPRSGRLRRVFDGACVRLIPVEERHPGSPVSRRIPVIDRRIVLALPVGIGRKSFVCYLSGLPIFPGQVRV